MYMGIIFSFPCNLTRCKLGDFDIIFIIIVLKSNIIYIRVSSPLLLRKKNPRCNYDAVIKKSKWICNSIPPLSFIAEHGQMFDMFHSPCIKFIRKVNKCTSVS